MALMATLIGDVVASRQIADRNQLHGRLADVLDRVNEHFDPTTPLRFTVGDEFQGAFATIESAARATLHLRVGLLPVADLRHGLGWGEVAVLQEDPRVEDGPGWWAAREAINSVHELQSRPATRWMRTAVRGEGIDRSLSAFLLLRDRAVDALDARAVAIVDGLLRDRSQRDIADALGISASAVSQRIRAGGLDALVLADLALDQA